MSNENQILTPAARLVQGSCFEANHKNMEGDQLTIKSGPNAGQPRVEYYIGVAIPKNNPEWPAIEAKIKEIAKAGSPTLFDAAGNLVNPQKGFAFKISDGDDPANAGKEGFAGHWILKLSNGFAPKVYNRENQPITDPEMVKRGYYIRVLISVKHNGSTAQPGVFLNFNMVQLLAHGEEIMSGPSAEEVFKAPVSLPAGATETPVATNVPMPEATPVTPAPDFATPPPPAKKMTAKANGMNYESFTAQGWTDEMLIQHGYMEA